MSKSPKSILPIYSSHSPTPFDHNLRIRLESSEGIDVNDWQIAPCSQTRDSDTLTRANFKAQDAALKSEDPEGNDHQLHRFGHWGPGWYEIVLVRPGSPCAVEAARLADALAGYPSLNDDLLSEMEWSEACDAWGPSDVREALIDAGVSKRTISNLPSMDREDAGFILGQWCQSGAVDTETISEGSSTYFRLRWYNENQRDAAAWAIRWLRSSTRA